MNAAEPLGADPLEEFLDALESGARRAAVPDPASATGWRVDEEVKRGVLACFAAAAETEISAGPFHFRDRDRLLPRRRLPAGVRIVPGGSAIRDGAFVARGVVCMPPMYVNVGAYVDEGTMIDSHALVGSCAQIGKRVHLSAAAQIGGVLEPAGALPVIVEDDVLVGGGCGVYEGAIVHRGCRARGGCRSHVVDAGVRPDARRGPPFRSGFGRAARDPGRGGRRDGIAARAGRFRARTRPVARRADDREAPRREDRCEDDARRGIAALKNALGDRRLAELADRYGTPFYAYDFDVFDEQARRLRAAVPSRFELFYAVKANPSLSVLSTFARRGLGADVASAGEIDAALAAGFPPDRLVMSGPAKSGRDAAAAVRAGILAVNAEGPAELDRLEAIAKNAKSRVDVQLRLNPRGRKAERIPILGGRGAGKFGVSIALARETLARRSCWPRLSISGFHVFQASNVLDAVAFVENVRRVLAIVLELARRSDVALRLVDLGGGFGIPYEPGEKPLDVAALKRGLSRIAAEIEREALFRQTRFLFEPGRYLTAPAGVYVCRVLDVKRDGRSSTFHALVDGGIHHLLRPALVGRHPVRGIPRRRRRRTAGPVTIGGPLCTSLDVLAEREFLPTPEPGDLVAFSNAGAYGYTESMPLFLSHPWAGEIGVRGERDAALRQPPTPAELLARQTVPRVLFAGRPVPPGRSETTSFQRVAAG